MMSATDHGVTVVLGPWDDVKAHIADHGLDPARVIRWQSGMTVGLALRADQVVFLDGWEPTRDERQWFWQCVATRMCTMDESRALFDMATEVPGLVWQ